MNRHFLAIEEGRLRLPSFPSTDQRSWLRRQVEFLEQCPAFLLQSSSVQGVDPVEELLEELVREIKAFWGLCD